MMKKSLWMAGALLLCSSALYAQGQIENSSFDEWEKPGKVWYARHWDSANKGTSTLGKNVTTPEEEFVAVKGPGKKAAKLESQFIGVLGIGKFASACLYTGHFVKVVGTSGSQMSFGIPFTHRPKSLHGYYCYRPGAIDYADKAHKSLLGTGDHAVIEVFVTTWKEPFLIDNTTKSEPGPQTPGLIGYGVLDLSKRDSGYIEFDIPISYTSDATPTYIGIMACSSRMGGTFTGSTGSVLYLDEFELRY